MKTLYFDFRKERLEKVFRKFDSDGNGTISTAEVQFILKDLKFTEEEIKRLIATHDSNQDGELQFQEFVHFWNECGGRVPQT